MMALESSKIIGNSIFNSGFSELMAGKISQCIRKAIKNDTIETIEYTLDVKGTLLLFEMRLVRLNDFSVVAIARDITSRKRTEFELERAKEKAEEADALKSRFLANLSDDIRNPVSIILSMTRMLAETDIPQDSRMQFIRDVENQGNSLLNMIENTIFLSRIETNTLDFRFSHVEINPLMKRIQRDFSLQLSSGSQVQLLLEQGILSEKAGFDTDPALLGEAVSRLLDNALKFTENGTIRFGYEAKGNWVCFYVEDTGPGIPEHEKENIFMRFYVIESDRKARKSGLGLGLPLAQHFVALLGGELKLNSIPGKGSRFWFDLPLLNPSGFMRIIQ
jgi:signal transduction histidine kinase